MSLTENIAKQLAALFKTALLDIRPQRNDLSRSELVKSIEGKWGANSIEVWAYEYAIYIDSGRRVGAKRVPLWALVDWIKRYNIGDGSISVNSLAFLIQRAIFENGIKPRPYLDQFTAEAIELITDKLLSEYETKLIRTFEDLKKK